MRRLYLLLFFISLASTPTMAQDADAKPKVLITNVNVFDGVNEKRIENASVLIEGNLIKDISTAPTEKKPEPLLSNMMASLRASLHDSRKIS